MADQSAHGVPKAVPKAIAQAQDLRGTAQQPLIVKVMPDEKSADDRDADNYERGEKRDLDRVTTRFAKVTGWATGALVLVAVVQAVLFLYQLRMMRQNLVDAKNAADAAVISADAARASADVAKLSMVASERPYVHFAGMRWISHNNTERQQVFWRLRPHWRNSGNTPTRSLRVYIQYELVDAPLPDAYAYTVNIDGPAPPASIEPGGVIGSAVHDVYGDEFVAIAGGHRHIYVWGVATYRSVFPDSPVYVTKFCVKAENVTGEPTAAWDPNVPFGIDWITHGPHNCSDDDCQI
jgi:hypothetical protein